jgi:hypothetical protein
MSYTRTSLITAVLDNLQRAGVGRAITTEDRDFVDGRLDAVLADLAQRDIYAFEDIGEVGPTGGTFDEAAYLHLVDYIVARFSKPFGAPIDREEMAIAERRLKTLSRIGRGTGKNLEIEQSLLRYPRGYGFNFTTGQ